MDEEWEELRRKQQLISDMMTLVRKSGVRRVASTGQHSDREQAKRESDPNMTPDDSSDTNS